MDIATLLQEWGLWAVGVGTFLEGETVLLLAGAAAARGHLALPSVIVVATLAGFSGDQLSFAIGRRWGATLLQHFPRLAPGAARVDALLARHHAPLILAIRFLYGLRVAGPIAIGMSHVPWRRFFVLNLLGAAVWAVLVAGIGYGVGHVLGATLHAMDADEFWALILLAFGTAWLLLRAYRWRARHTRRPESMESGI